MEDIAQLSECLITQINELESQNRQEKQKYNQEAANHQVTKKELEGGKLKFELTLSHRTKQGAHSKNPRISREISICRNRKGSLISSQN